MPLLCGLEICKIMKQNDWTFEQALDYYKSTLIEIPLCKS